MRPEYIERKFRIFYSVKKQRLDLYNKRSKNTCLNHKTGWLFHKILTDPTQANPKKIKTGLEYSVSLLHFKAGYTDMIPYMFLRNLAYWATGEFTPNPDSSS
jgi:hypothetical protein